MKADKANKIRLLKIWEILTQETDEDHPIGTVELIGKLRDIGVQCDRRTLYTDIKVLNDYGYEVLCKRGVSNEYYVVDRSFDIPELRILLDAVQAASFITEHKTATFVDKIASLAGSRSGEVLKQNIVAFNTTKNTNESIYYIVNEIATAINGGFKIEFSYFDYNMNRSRVYRGNGKRYVVNPIATVFSNDNYYLACYDDKHVNMSHYRVDRMDMVKILEERIPDDRAFDIKKHKKQVFSMFVGREERVTFVISKSLIDTVYDKFGDVRMALVDGDKIRFSADVQVSRQFYGWCLGFGRDLTVTAPKGVVTELKEYLRDISDGYGE